MSQKSIHFNAQNVECSEAMDFEIVRVTFDTEASGFDEENRTSEFISLSTNFEFGNVVQIEFHDRVDYDADSLKKIDLWRNKAIAISARGVEFVVNFDLMDDAFSELRNYLKLLLGSDCLRK